MTAITVTANSATKVFDGAPLTEDGFTHSALPNGITHITTAISGSQTDEGSSPNVIIIVTLWNGTLDVTEFFPNIILNPGLLTVTPAPEEPTVPEVPVIPGEPTPPAPPVPPAPPAITEPPAVEAEIDDPTTPLAEPAVPVPAEDDEEDEDDEIIIVVEDRAVPLARPTPGAGPNGFWALWNLILSIAGALLALMMCVRILITKNRKEKDEDEYQNADPDESEEDEKARKRRRLLLILAVPILAIIAIIVFIITQDMRLQITLTDWWTLLHVIVFALGLVCYFFAFRRKNDEEDEDGEEVIVEAPHIN